MKRALLLIAASAAVYASATWWATTRLRGGDVAMQVNADGEVNRYASRAGAISYFTGLGGFLLALAVVCLCLCQWLPLRFLNIRHKEYWTTSERAPIVRRMVVWDAAVILSMPLLALSFLPINVALLTDDPAASDWWIIAPFAIWLIAMASYVIWILTRRYRPAPG